MGYRTTGAPAIQLCKTTDIIANSSLFWKIMRKIAPLAPRTKDIEDPIDDPTAVNFGRSTGCSNGWADKRFDDGPLRIGHIGRVGGSVHRSRLVSFLHHRAVSIATQQRRVVTIVG